MKKLFELKKPEKGKKGKKITAILALTVTLTAFGAEYLKSIDDAQNQVVVSFDTQGGEDIPCVVIDKGTSLGKIPCADRDDSFFTGWCYDEQLTQPFFAGDTLEKDTLLYASYEVSEDNDNVKESTELYQDDCDPKSKIVLHSEDEITEENLSDYLNVESFLGDIPDGFTVLPLGNGDYEVVPNQDYKAGCTYDFTALNGASIVTEDSNKLTELSQKIHKDESEVVELKNDIVYLDWDDVIKDGSDYNLYIPKSDEYTLTNDTPLCMLNGYNEWVAEGSNQETYGMLFDDDCLFITAESVSVDFKELTIGSQTVNDEYWYYVEAVDGDLEDIISDVDVFEEFEVPANEVIDIEQIEQNLNESDGIKQMADLLSCAIMEDEEFIRMAAESNSDTSDDLSVFNPISVSAANDSGLLFRDGLYMTQKKGVKVPVRKDSIKVGVYWDNGHASNPNFPCIDRSDPDGKKWSAMQVVVDFETEIKGVSIWAQIDITEYMKVTMQGYKDWDGGKLEFDYAANIYTQTNFDFTVQIKTDGSGQWEDISNSVTGNMKNADLVNKYKKMINADGGYIELVDTEIIGRDYYIIEQFPLFNVHLGLNYVLKFDLAAGINSNFTYLDATQVGMRGKTGKGNYLESYSHELLGANRYAYDLTACGYVGVKTGLKGSLTLSFSGLSKFGKIGISIELGAYCDMYGYLDLSIAKPDQFSNNVEKSFSGAYYMELGIYLEVKLFAAAEAFGAEAEWPIIDEKWKLFSIGNQYIPLQLTGASNTEYFMHQNNGSIFDICGISALCMDMKTGDIVDKKPQELGMFYVRMSDKAFSVDYDKMTLSIDGSGNNRKARTSTIEVYSDIPTFSNLGDNYTDSYFCGSTKLYWADPSLNINSIDDFSKTYKATYCLKFPDGTIQELDSKEVMASEPVYEFDFSRSYANGNDYIFDLNETMYTDDDPDVASLNGGHDLELEYYYIDKDTVFYRDAEKYPFYVYFLYYDDTVNQWKGDIRLCKAGETPVPPEEAMKTQGMTGWNCHDNVIGEDFTGIKPLSLNGFYYQNRNYYTMAEGETTLPESVKVYSAEDKSTARYDTESYFDIKYENGKTFYANRERAFAQVYVATYNDCSITFNYKDVVDGKLQTISSAVTLPFDGLPQSPAINFIDSIGKLVGWDTDGDGLPDTETNKYGEVIFPRVHTDGTVFTAIYEQPEVSINLMTYNYDTEEYEEYTSFNIANDQSLTFNGEKVLLDGEPVSLDGEDDIFAKLIGELSEGLTFKNWEIAYSYPYSWFEPESVDIQWFMFDYYIRPKVEIEPVYTFLPLEGTTFTVKSDSGETTEKDQFARKVTAEEIASGTYAWWEDFDYDIFTGNEDEIVRFAGWDTDDDGIADYQIGSVIDIPKNTTFKAVTETTPNELEVNIISPAELDFPVEIASLIKLTEGSEYNYKFKGVYSDYEKLMDYIGSLSENVYTDEETGYTCYYYQSCGFKKYNFCFIDGQLTTISYFYDITISKSISGHKVTFDAGEDGYFIDYDGIKSQTFTETLMNGTYDINDFTIYSTKSPHRDGDSGVYYYVDYWMDENGNPIENDEFTVFKESRTLTAHWKSQVYVKLSVNNDAGEFSVGNDYQTSVQMRLEEGTYTYDVLIKPEQTFYFTSRYELAGWKDSRDDEDIIHSVEEEFTIASGEKDIEFTAVFERTGARINFRIVSDDIFTEGSGENLLPGNDFNHESQVIIPFGQYKASDLPKLEDKENDMYLLRFTGWKDQNKTLYRYDDDNTVIEFNDPLDLDPVYEKIACRVEFSAGGGKFSDGSLSMTYKLDVKEHSASEFPVPTRENTAYEGYEFTGWNIQGNGAGEVAYNIPPDGTFDMHDTCYKIEAIWECTELSHQYKYVYDENEHWKICINESCSEAEAGEKQPHTPDDDGICTECGYGCTTPPLNNGKYEISNAAQLFGFARLVNEGNANANAILMCDITINENVIDAEGNLVGSNLISWTPIGKDSGTYYSGVFDGNGKTISGLYYNELKADSYAGLFGELYEAEVCDLIIADSYFAVNPNCSSVGGVAAAASSSTISSVENRATVSGYRAGGICASAYGEKIENCLNTGKIIAQDRAAGIAYGSISIINCCSSGKMIVSAGCTAYSISSSTNIVNSFCNTDLCVDSAENDTCGRTSAQFVSGEVAYLLSKGENGSVWGQTIGTDETPVLNGAKVYKTEKYEGCEGNKGKVTYSYSNTESAPIYILHSYDCGFCKICGGYQPADPNEDGVYEIDNAGKLYWFAQEVNHGNTGINAVLTENISVNKGENIGDVANCGGVKQDGWIYWTPVGSESAEFTGSFDGQGHTISGLLFNSTTAQYAGLFGVNNGSISNVGVTDSCFNTANYAGGICGQNNGTITNCYYTGTVTGNGSLGGICGSNTGSIANCFSTDETGAICTLNEEGTITNCYYLAEKAYENGGKTATQFESGEVAYLLSQGCTVGETIYDGSVWGQTIGTEDYPVLGGKKVLANVDESQFANDIIIYGQNVVLDGTIGFNIYVSAYENYDWDKTVSGVQGEEIEKGLYKFTYQVAAKDMDKEIQFTVNDKIDVTVSVSKYLDELSETDNESLKNLANSMSAYGVAAKAFFSSGTVAEQIIADDLSVYDFAVGTMPEGISYYGSSLILESETTIRHYFTLAEDMDISELKFSVGDESVSFAESEKNPGYYYIDIKNVSAEKLGTSFNVSVNGEEVITNYSALSYVNKVLDSDSADDNLKNLVKALYIYNQNALVYNAA